MYISQIVRKKPKGSSVRVFVRKNLKNNKTSDIKIVKNFLKYEKKVRACTSSYFINLKKQ